MPTVGFSLGTPMGRLNAQDMGVPDLAMAIAKGLKLGYMPQQLADKQEADQLLNAKARPYAAGAQKMFDADLGLKEGNLSLLPLRQQLLEAQAKRQSQLADMPFGGQLTGSAKEAYALEMMRQQLGEDHPAYQNAKKAYDLGIQSQEGLNNYRQSLMGTANKRASSNLGKLDQEQAEVEQGFMPGTNGQVQLSPEQQQEMLGQYQLQRQKVTSDTDTRKKALFATNIDKTLDSIDVGDLTQFAGVAGGIVKKMQEGKALNNKENESYRKYQKSLTAAKLLAKQVRQFYGDSITPGVQEQLGMLTNPASWFNNPEIATQKFNQFKSILKNETQTYRDAMRNTGIYQGQYESQAPEDNVLTYNPLTGSLE